MWKIYRKNQGRKFLFARIVKRFFYIHFIYYVLDYILVLKKVFPG